MYIPKLEMITKKEYRNSMIFTDCMNGMSYKAVAQKYGLSEMAVRKIVAVRKKNEQS